MPADAVPQAAATPGLYRLLAWLSPGFPTGAYSFSHGLEAALAAGKISDRDSLGRWVTAIVAHGSGRVDADILRDAFRAAVTDDEAALAAAGRRGAAFRATAELALESTQQGAAFLAAYEATWQEAADPNGSSLRPSPLMGEGLGGGDAATSRRAERSPPPRPSPIDGEGVGGAGAMILPRRDAGEICHAAVFGWAAARAGIALADALVGFLEAFAANLVSAGIRLGIVGQTDGQRILFALEPIIAAAAAAAMRRDEVDFGGATFAADLLSSAHETQYSRLFRS